MNLTMSTQNAVKCFLRQRMLGSEAIYGLLEQGDEVSTAVVIRAPGLASGTHVRLMARATRAMERVEAVEIPAAEAARFVPPLAA
jgi:hypothetical protein